MTSARIATHEIKNSEYADTELFRGTALDIVPLSTYGISSPISLHEFLCTITLYTKKMMIKYNIMFHDFKCGVQTGPRTWTAAR